MSISIFDLFSIGIGPSSSHTVGPMRAAKAFALSLQAKDLLLRISRITTTLYGSLALTGKGHGTDKAVLNGLEGKQPETANPDKMVPRMQTIIAEQRLNLLGQKNIHFDAENDLRFNMQEFLPEHSNGMRFDAFDPAGKRVATETYFSIGGGFINTQTEISQQPAPIAQPYPFHSCAELLAHCHQHQLTIAELILENEKVWRNETEIRQQIFKIVDVMEACINKGCDTEGFLPGGLKVKRRAATLYHKLHRENQGLTSIHEHTDIMNWLNLYAMAVNEENAAGGRIVTAPTNGAAGIIPAVMKYYKALHREANDEGLMTYFLTAGAIAILYKKGASISGAEVGCQGEIGVAASMAAGGLAAALGGDLAQIENAAEIAMEHHLGMTCDPIGGLVQIPCIERNAMGTLKAVNAARMALIGDGQYKVSLDNVIKTMMQTGKDMMSHYKETSQGGLAVNVIEC